MRERVTWEEVQEALDGWRDLEAYLPEACLRVPPPKAPEEAGPAPADAAPPRVGSDQEVRPEAEEDVELGSWGVRDQGDDAGVSGATVLPREPAGSLEGVAWMRDALRPLLRGKTAPTTLQLHGDVLAEGMRLTATEWAFVFAPTEKRMHSVMNKLPYAMGPPVDIPSPEAMRGLLRDLPAEPLAAYVVGAVMPFYIWQGLHVDTSAQLDSGDAAVTEWQDTILPDVLQAVLAEAFRVAKLQRTPPGDFARLMTALSQHDVNLEEQLGLNLKTDGNQCATSGLRNACTALASELRLLYLGSTGVDPLR